MKFYGAIALLLCIACTQASYFRGNYEEEPEKEKKAAKDAPPAEEGGDGAKKEPADDKPPPLKGPAHSDNFQDELVDQADPEFKMLDADGDGCVTVEETKVVMRQQFQQGAPDINSMPEQDKKEMEQMMERFEEEAENMFGFVDKNKDQCIDKTEFKAAQEMEGPPPGYQSTMEDEMGEEEFEEYMEEDEKAEFDFMDRSGDGKISKTEAYNYADKNMPHADISKEMLDNMFDATDTNKDGFLTFDEFSDAGKNYDGDGNEMENAEPMGGDDHDAEPQEGENEGDESKKGDEDGADPADEEAEAEVEEKNDKAKDTALHQKKHQKKAHKESMSFKMISARQMSLRAGAKERMLAQKTPLKVMAKLFGSMKVHLRRSDAEDIDKAPQESLEELDGDEDKNYEQAEIAEEEEELNKDKEA